MKADCSIAGFSLGRNRLTLEAYDDLAAGNALELVDRWATWDGAVFTPGTDYAVSVHRKNLPSGRRRTPTPTDRLRPSPGGRGPRRSVRLTDGSRCLAHLEESPMTITDLPPTAIHRGEEELPFVDIGDGGTLQLLQVDLANGVWIVRNHFAPDTTIQTHKHTGHVLAFTQKGSWFYKEYPDVVNTAGLLSLRAGGLRSHPPRPGLERRGDRRMVRHPRGQPEPRCRRQRRAGDRCPRDPSLLPGRLRRTTRHDRPAGRGHRGLRPMRAAVLTDERPRLEMADLPSPVPGPGEALLRITGCGICGSDLHLASQLAAPGAVLGHEIAGVVAGVGAGVDAARWPDGTAVVARPVRRLR